MNQIRIIICDDQEIVREGLKLVLQTDPDIQITTTAVNGEDLLNKIKTTGIPELVLMDLKMPVLNGIQTIYKLRSRYESVKILVLTTFNDDQWIMDAIRAGASGYLLKDTPRANLIDALKGTVMGQNFIDPSIAGKLLAMASGSKPRPQISSAPEVSPREKQILILIARGFSNSEIAGKLYLAEGTIRNYTSNLFQKMKVADRTDAAITALRHGTIALEEI